VVPPEGYSHRGGLAAPLFREGRRTEDAQQSSKKKTMKTNTKNQTGLGSKSAQLSTENRPKIDFKKRRSNRSLNTEKLLALLKSETPKFFALAEVVGKWVWIQFTDKQPSEVTRILAELGFHWNNNRQTWQHPCGTLVQERADYDPRKRYGSYFAAAGKLA
jgi:hypothetical protein